MVTGNSLNIVEPQVALNCNLSSERSVHTCLVGNDVEFPGDILLGADFLNRFSYVLSVGKSLSACRLRLGNTSFPVKFTEFPPLSAVIRKKPKNFGIVNLINIFEEGKSPNHPSRLSCFIHAPSKAGLSP